MNLKSYYRAVTMILTKKFGGDQDATSLYVAMKIRNGAKFALALKTVEQHQRKGEGYPPRHMFYPKCGWSKCSVVIAETAASLELVAQKLQWPLPQLDEEGRFIFKELNDWLLNQYGMKYKGASYDTKWKYISRGRQLGRDELKAEARKFLY